MTESAEHSKTRHENRMSHPYYSAEIFIATKHDTNNKATRYLLFSCVYYFFLALPAKDRSWHTTYHMDTVAVVCVNATRSKAQQMFRACVCVSELQQHREYCVCHSVIVFNTLCACQQHSNRFVCKKRATLSIDGTTDVYCIVRHRTHSRFSIQFCSRFRILMLCYCLRSMGLTLWQGMENPFFSTSSLLI